MEEKLKQYKEKGYFIAEDVITKEEVSRLRDLCDNYFSNYPIVPYDGGAVVPGWAGFSPGMEEFNDFHKDPRILAVAEAVLGKEYVFAEHADLHQNKITGWHRDVGDYRRGGGVWPDWEDDFHVIKICFLLQDHTDNDYGLSMDEGSHKPGVDGNHVRLHSRPQDAIVFDQRISHRGQGQQYKDEYSQHRYLITYGYGIPNQKTLKHIVGCKSRQAEQRSRANL